MNIAREYGRTRAETVQRLAYVHTVVKDPEVADALVAQFDTIVVHPCDGSPLCSDVDVRLVAWFSGPNGCARRFIASQGHLVDVTSNRLGKIGNGFRDLFNLNIRLNCDGDNAVGLVMLDALEGGVPSEQLEERELVGPVTWSEFKRAKGNVAQGYEKEALTTLGRQRFFFVRIGRRQVEGATGADWTKEGFVLTDTCTVVPIDGGK